MWRIALRQARSSAGRLGAAAVAIVLGSAFVAATLLAGATMETTTHRTMAASYADADLVISAEGIPLDQVQELSDLPGVSAADPISHAAVQVALGDQQEATRMGPAPSDDRLSTATVQDGGLPAGAGEVALVADTAERLGAGVGDEVTLTWEEPTSEDDGGTSAGEEGTGAAEEPQVYTHSARVVGLLAPPASHLAMGPQVLTDAGTFHTWAEEAGGPDGPQFAEVIALIADDADVGQVRGDIERGVPGATVQTVTERAEELTAMFAGDDYLLTALGLGFAAVALAVAALVIANTFTVLVAQRTRTLALLRCVGASKRQIRGSVMIEATALGLLSAAVGLGLGVAVVAVGLRVLSGIYPEVPLDPGVHLSPGIVAVTLLTGVLVTVGAATIPARLATRVAPLAALQPVEGPPERRAGRVRAMLTILTLVAGSAMLAGAVALTRGAAEDTSVVLLALAIGVVGGLLALLGLLLGAVFGVPALIRLAGRLLGRGVPARTAIANAVRNPRRTGATASALMIGVALVTMMSTGAMTASESLARGLDERFSVDLTMDAGPGGPALPDEQVQLLREHTQITDVVLLSGGMGQIEMADGSGVGTQVVAADDEELGQVLRDAAIGTHVPTGTAVLPRAWGEWYGLENGEEVTLTGDNGTPVSLQVHLSGIDNTALVAPEVLAETIEEPEAVAAWARVAETGDEIQVARDIQASLADAQTTAPAAPAATLGGTGAERAAYEQVIDTLLIIVVALLGVSVVIALVGVANTLSLSVLERRRESAMLRALGLSRGQLRAMLAGEAVLISLAGAVIGVLAGLAFGWTGATVLLAGIGDVTLVVPWQHLVIVLAVALTAGLLASVLPARSALRDAPVAALAGP